MNFKCPSGHKLSKISDDQFTDDDVSCCLCSTEMINSEPFYWQCRACFYDTCHFCAYESHTSKTAKATKRKATKSKQQDIKALNNNNNSVVYEMCQDQVKILK